MGSVPVNPMGDMEQRGEMPFDFEYGDDQDLYSVTVRAPQKTRARRDHYTRASPEFRVACASAICCRKMGKKTLSYLTGVTRCLGASRYPSRPPLKC